MTELRLSALETCLLAFETACPEPTAEQIEQWCAQFPQYADDIREHAKYVDRPIAYGKEALALLSEEDKEKARAEAFEIMDRAFARDQRRFAEQHLKKNSL